MLFRKILSARSLIRNSAFIYGAGWVFIRRLMWEYFFQSPPWGALLAVVAVVTLWFPRHLYRWKPRRKAPPVRRASSSGTPGQRRKLVFRSRSIEDDALPRQDEISLRESLTQSDSWVDFFRAAVAGHALINYALVFEWAKFSPVPPGMAKLVVYSGISVIAILMQMMRRVEGSVRMAVPVPFILGLCAGYLFLGADSYGKHFAIVSIAMMSLVAAKPIITGPASALGVFVPAFASVGYFFFGIKGSTYAIAQTVTLCAFPLVMHLLFNYPMYTERFTKEVRSRNARPAAT